MEGEPRFQCEESCRKNFGVGAEVGSCEGGSTEDWRCEDWGYEDWGYEDWGYEDWGCEKRICAAGSRAQTRIFAETSICEACAFRCGVGSASRHSETERGDFEAAGRPEFKQYEFNQHKFKLMPNLNCSMPRNS
jgi:hypothetical protein